MRSPVPARLCLLLAALLLPGCSSDDKAMKVCPRVAVLTEAGTVTRFEPDAGTDILDINFQADVGDLITTCTYPPTKGNRRVVVQVTPVFVVTRGAANTDRKAGFTYFVSVVRNGEILSKEPFDVTGEFSGNRSRTIIQDDELPVTVTIPLATRGAEYEYEILVGIQLTADELAYNQRWHGLGR